MIILITTTLSFIIFFYYKKISNLINLYDFPDIDLKKHKFVTAPIGGIFIFFIFITTFFLDQIFLKSKIDFFSNNLEFNLFLFFCFILLIIGIVDDKIKLRSNLKLIIFILLFTLYCFFSNDIALNYFYTSFEKNNFNLGKLSILFSVFCYISFTQAFNMYDGLDKQSGLLLLVYLIFFYYLTNFSLIFLYLLIPLIFFLIYNKKGKLFLGNNGSNFLSFFIAVIAIRLAENQVLTVEDILVLFAIPGYELIRLFFFRIKENKSPLNGDLNHIHHLLIKKFNYLQTLLIILSLTIIPVLGIILKVQIYILIFIQLISYIFLIYYTRSQ